MPENALEDAPIVRECYLKGQEQKGDGVLDDPAPRGHLGILGYV